MAVSDFGNLRSLSSKISAAHKASNGKWLYMRENLEGVDKLANVGLLLLGKIWISTFSLRAIQSNVNSYQSSIYDNLDISTPMQKK